jgi:hypothetical protein
MGFLDWFTGKDPFCTNQLNSIFSGFVDAVIDSAVAAGPVVAPPRRSEEPAKRHFLRLPAVRRLVVLGDVHGDISQMRKALRAAGLIDDRFYWAGGSTVAVQERFKFVCQLKSANRRDHLHCNKD